MLRRNDKPADRITWAFRSVTSRAPSSAELKLLLADLRSYEKEFTNEPGSAKKLLNIGERKADAKLPPARLAAYTLIANTLLNLDEAIMQN